MNRIAGTIKAIQTEGSLTLVSLETTVGTLTSIVIDTPKTCTYLAVDRTVVALFKETEVAIGIGSLDEISLRNRVKGTITELESGKLLTQVTLETLASPITAIITSQSAQALQLAVGVTAFALIKTNEIMLAE